VAGALQVELRVNSIGDGECRPAYREKLIAYLEPHEAELDEDCRTRLRTNPLRVFDCKVDGKTLLVLGAPVISENLCQPCAEHFAAVRNGLDAAGIASCTTRGWCAGWTTTRGRRSSRVGRSPRRRRVAVAGGTTARRGARRTAHAGVGFALGWTGCSSPCARRRLAPGSSVRRASW
jgi:hypothetical protein